MADKTPFEIAREIFQLLTARKLQPTPDNYQALYHEIAGTKRLQAFPEDQLQAIAKALPVQTPGQQRLQGQVSHAVRHHNWTALQQALVSYTQLSPTPRPLAELASPTHHGEPHPPTSILTPEFKEQLVRLIEHTLPAIGVEDSQLGEQTKQLLLHFRQAEPNLVMLKTMLTNFNFRLTFVAEEHGAIKNTLLELLHLVFVNIGELSLDERWLKGQMDALISAATPPLTLRRLEDVRIRLKDVIYKQIEAKALSMTARDEMKRILAAFIERLASMSDATGSFRNKIEQCAKQIEGATSISDIAPVLQDAITAARTMSLDTQRAGDELRAMREQTALTEERLAQLQVDLDRASAQARHDPLTGALNRKGLDEAMEREIANVKRKGVALCVSLLDIDNFKKFNDLHGHQTGDAALVHLTQVTRECIRPQDTLGRYGGEEFVVLMPDTVMEQGIEVMTRLQRELTKRFFLAGNDKLLITFSAGVAELGAEESSAEAVVRADQAMYIAKRTGKNRVLGA